MYNVLIVDDEEIIRLGLQKVIKWEAYGFTVIGAVANGIKAMEFIDQQKVNVVFTDIRMPLMSGLELAKAIYEKDKCIKIVILSGYSEFSYAQEAIKHNVFGYLLKPSKKNDIVDILAKLKVQLDVNRNTGTSILIPEEIFSNERSNKIIKVAAEKIALEYAKEITLETLSSYLGITPSYLSKLFKSELGINFKEYLTEIRMAEAKKLLRNINLKVYEIAGFVGYSDQRYFSEIFKSKTGMSPLEYREKLRY
jgi:two-component system response regulator YesN